MDPVKPPDADPMTWDKDRADYVARLGQSAFERSKQRGDSQWKAGLALWTGLGAGAGFILSSNWTPAKVEVAGVTLFAVLLAVLYGVWNQWVITGGTTTSTS